MSFLFDVKPDERKIAGLAFASLFGITAAHTLIETARDALFLAKLPVTQLPLLYLAIAAVGLAMTRAGAAFARGDGVASPILAAAGITVGFWGLSGTPNRALLYALYVFAGIFASWVSGRLWIRLGGLFDVGQAKRLYGLVGTGSVLGAVFGAAVARTSLSVFPVRHLLLLGAVVLIGTAIGPATLLPMPKEASATASPSSLAGGIAEVTKNPYLVRILGLALLAAASGTAIDFLFKSEIAKMPAGQIAPFLATVSLATNALSLVAQAVGVGVAMRVLGVHRALYVMPLLLALSSPLVFLGLGLYAALAMRGIDGALRYSLHKTGTELLFVPLPDGMRARAKPIIDLVGQRGGQAVASIAILGVAALVHGRTTFVVGVAVLVLASAWLVLASGIRPRYLDVFRTTLSRGRSDFTSELPELDMSALEALISALSSRRDPVVLGALDLLAAQSRGRLIPTLVLFHPSKPIVLRALELLVREGRTEFVPVADRLLAHADPEIRVAALRARAAVDPDPRFLRELLTDADDAIRATALVSLTAAGGLDAEEARKAIAAAEADVDTRRALARAIGEVRATDSAGPIFEATLRRLLGDRDRVTRQLAATASGKLGRATLVPPLVALLDDRLAGVAAIDALAELGTPAAKALEALLDDAGARPETQWRAIRAMGRLPEAGIPRLARRVTQIKDPTLVTRMLRVLRLARVAGHAVDIPRDRLVMLGVDTVAGIARSLGDRVAHDALLTAQPAMATPGAALVQRLLRDREIEGADRLFLVLGLLYPKESFTRIQRGLASTSKKARASSRELLENVVDAPLRDAVLVIADESSDEARLAKLGTRPVETSYIGLLRGFIAQEGELASLAAYHATEVGLADAVRDAVASAGSTGTIFGDVVSSGQSLFVESSA